MAPLSVMIGPLAGIVTSSAVMPLMFRQVDMNHSSCAVPLVSGLAPEFLIVFVSFLCLFRSFIEKFHFRCRCVMISL